MSQKGSAGFAIIVLIIVLMFAAFAYVLIVSERVSDKSAKLPASPQIQSTSSPGKTSNSRKTEIPGKSENNSQNCAGTYLTYDSKSPTGYWGYVFENEYDFYELKDLAVSKGMEVKIDEDYSYLNRTLEDIGKYYKNLGLDLKEGDNIKKDPLLIVVMNNEVKITGPYMRVTKRISENESYEFTFSFLPDDHLKPAVRVTQNGSCDLEHSYIKDQVKHLLNSLSVESDWVNEAEVNINSIAYGFD